MKSGLLWFDDNPKISIATKIDNAARHYQEKFGRLPNICYVHPHTLAGTTSVSTRVRVVELHSVLPNHFWVGVA